MASQLQLRGTRLYKCKPDQFRDADEVIGPRSCLMKLPQIYNILKARPSLHCPQGTPWNFLATGVFYLQLVDQKASFLFIILYSFPRLSWQKTLRHHQRPIIIKHIQPSPKTHPKTQETSSRTTKHQSFSYFFPNLVISLISNRCLE